VNAGAQRTPNNPVQRTLTDTASTISTGVRQVLDSGAKLVRRNKNQATSDTAQQDTTSMSANAPSINTPDGCNSGNNATSMTVNTPSINTPDGSNLGNNAGQGYDAMDVLRDASFLSDFGALASQVSQASQTSQNPHAGTNVMLEFSPIGNQIASPVGSDVASGINLNTPPR